MKERKKIQPIYKKTWVDDIFQNIVSNKKKIDITF